MRNTRLNNLEKKLKSDNGSIVLSSIMKNSQEEEVNENKKKQKGSKKQVKEIKIIEKTYPLKVKIVKNLEQYVKQFEEQWGLNALDNVEKQPTYQQIKTIFSLKRRINIKKTRKIPQQAIINGVVGLKNLGNTCYVNSTIQLLSNIQPLCDYFTEVFQCKEINRNNPLSSRGVITLALKNLLKELWKPDQTKLILTKYDNPACVPQEFLQLVSYFNPQYGQRTQEDAQEFLLYILDVIHEDLNRVQFPPPLTPVREYIAQKEKLEESEILASVSWRDYLTRSKSIIVDLMQGQVKNSIRCLECNNSLYKFEPIMFMSVPVDKNQASQSLDECVESYLSEETLSIDNQWSCNKCSKMVQCAKKIDLWKLPTILVIHLKRFKFEENAAQKITTEINFPTEYFDLSQHVTKFQKEKPIYELLGCICHFGKISKGHYVTYARNKDNFKWYLFNDLQVTEINPEDIPKESVYLFIYGKSTIPLVKRQTLSMPDNWPHLFHQ